MPKKPECRHNELVYLPRHAGVQCPGCGQIWRRERRKEDGGIEYTALVKEAS